jgi:hypothetical protein
VRVLGARCDEVEPYRILMKAGDLITARRADAARIVTRR